MNESIQSATPLEAVHTVHLPVSGDLRRHVCALVGIEASIVGSLPLSIAPHDAVVLAVQFRRNGQELDIKSGLGSNTRFTGIRQWTGPSPTTPIAAWHCSRC